MASNMKTLFIAISYLLFSNAILLGVSGDAPCGNTSIFSVAWGLTSCVDAAKNPSVKPPRSCCTKTADIFSRTSASCICSVFLSPLAKQVGIKPAVAITIPKRCGLKKRPVGYKCGRKNSTL
ncbi:hypothetical protein AMTR_s00104p00068440 [Amborella trichopoda]|uniref:Bifunctional inhibitor/plant lipid transfer protein/seed storage helical domain-containing protein n=1 Tax=Amborella trichopoda TaxID=13333 RepID=W1P071_AMBTC|nr:hypothetical protein AMTR_s00104p00068440 [Amborella trichopoda]